MSQITQQLGTHQPTPSATWEFQAFILPVGSWSAGSHARASSRRSRGALPGGASFREYQTRRARSMPSVLPSGAHRAVPARPLQVLPAPESGAGRCGPDSWLGRNSLLPPDPDAARGRATGVTRTEVRRPAPQGASVWTQSPRHHYHVFAQHIDF